MGKNKKKTMDEINSCEKNMTKLQADWAKKRDKDYPLALGDLSQWQLETLVQKRFEELKSIFAENNHSPKSAAADKITYKLWPLWTYDDVVRDAAMFTLMPEAKMVKAVKSITNAIHYPISHYPIFRYPDGYTILSLSRKDQRHKESVYGLDFGRAAIIVSPSTNASNRLFIGDGTAIDATFYVGYVYDKADKDAWLPQIGFLVFEDADMREYAVEIPEFSALVEIAKDKGYLFTFYSKLEETLLIKRLANLENTDIFSGKENMEGAAITESAPVITEDVIISPVAT